jgi:hypothetical protein
MSLIELDLDMLQAQIDEENVNRYEALFGVRYEAPITAAGPSQGSFTYHTLGALGTNPSFHSTIPTPTSHSETTSKLTMKALEGTPVLREIVEYGRIQFYSDAYGADGAWHQPSEKILAGEALYEAYTGYVAMELSKPEAERRLPETGTHFPSP